MKWNKIKEILSWDKLKIWLIYSLLIGITPILCRLYVYVHFDIEPFSISDFVFLGLAISFGNINEGITVMSKEGIENVVKFYTAVFLSLNSLLILGFGSLIIIILQKEVLVIKNFGFTIFLLAIFLSFILLMSYKYYKMLRNHVIL